MVHGKTCRETFSSFFPTFLLPSLLSLFLFFYYFSPYSLYSFDLLFFLFLFIPFHLLTSFYFSVNLFHHFCEVVIWTTLSLSIQSSIKWMSPISAFDSAHSESFPVPPKNGVLEWDMGGKIYFLWSISI